MLFRILLLLLLCGSPIASQAKLNQKEIKNTESLIRSFLSKNKTQLDNELGNKYQLEVNINKTLICNKLVKKHIFKFTMKTPWFKNNKPKPIFTYVIKQYTEKGSMIFNDSIFINPQLKQLLKAYKNGLFKLREELTNEYINTITTDLSSYSKDTLRRINYDKKIIQAYLKSKLKLKNTISNKKCL
jgi:hypothetical protein